MTPQKILIVFQKRPPIADYLEREFSRRGIDVVKFYSDQNTWFDRWVINKVNKQLHNLRILPKTSNLFTNHPWAHRNYLNTRLSEVYRETRPELCIAIRGMDIGLDAIRQMACPKIGWWVEPETHIHEAIAEAKNFDWYFCMNEACIQSLRDNGYLQTDYLQHAVDIAAFHPIEAANKKYDLCFVGKHSDKRQKFIEAALEVTPNIAVYGPRWKSKNIGNPAVRQCIMGDYIAGESLNRLYNESRVVLNVTLWDGQGGLRSGMNMRLMEVPASGACLLTDESVELGSYFAAGKDLIVYSDLDDFKRKLAWCLSHPEQILSIAKRGFETVTSKYTYTQTAERILNQYRQITGDMR